MPPLPLTTGAYTARSIIANAQRCVNLFAESNPPDAPFPFTFYQRPGLRKLATADEIGGRGLYQASQGDLFAVIGAKAYFINSAFAFVELGAVESGSTPVSFIDNGRTLTIATGTPNVGYRVDLKTHEFSRIGTGLGPISVISKGTGYTSAPTVGIGVPDDPNGRQAIAHAVLDGTTVGSVVVDNPGTGYFVPPHITLIGGAGTGATASSTIDDENWLGSIGMGYVDTFLIFSKPNSNLFYTSLSNTVKMDPLYFAGKVGAPDLLATLAIVHREIWLIGTKTTEVWFNSGNPAFPFALMQGVFIEHGTEAPRSVQTHGLELFWLSRDKDGHAIVVMGTSYQAKRISQYAIETEMSSYSRIDDAIGMMIQIEGHVFYVLTFPTADKTWVFDMMEGLWHEWTWTDGDGNEHRSRCGAMAFAYGKHVALDWQNGNLYEVTLEVYDDARWPIVYRRGFPHLYNESNRVSYTGFIAEMEVGSIPEGLYLRDEYDFNGDFNNDFDIYVPGNDLYYEIDPNVYLRWSDTRGKSWGNPIPQSLGPTGAYGTSVQWNRLGMARDRVFELFWSIPTKTALNGAAIDVVPFGS